MRILCLFTALAALSTTIHATEYYKWVDKNGVTAYSATPPPVSAKKKAKVSTYAAASGTGRSNGNSSNYYGGSQSTDYSYSTPKNTNYSNQFSGLDAQLRYEQRKKESQDRQDLIGSIKPDSKGRYTAAQRQALAGLDNGQSSQSNYSAPIQRAPSNITNCDSTGCWGSDGTRYNKGAGSTYFPSTGGSCQSIGGQMQCN